MALFYRNEKTAPRGADLAFSLKGQLHRNPVFQNFSGLADDREHGSKRRWATKLNIVLRRNRTRGFAQLLVVHKGDSGGPIPMTIEQGADDTTVHHTREGLVVFLWKELHAETPLYTKGVDLETVFVGWTTAKAN